MKKIFATFFIFIATMLCVQTVKADKYSDDIRKLVAEGSLLGINGDQFSMLSMIPGNNKLSGAQLSDVLVEAMTPYFRENMTEEELSQMVDFYSRDDVKAANAKVAKAGITEDVISTDVVMQVMQGGTPSDIEPKQCDAEFAAAFEKYYKVKNTEEVFPSLIEPLTKSVKQLVPYLPNGYEQQIKEGITRLFTYLKRNAKAMMLNELVGKVTPAELYLLASEADQPFYAASEKTSKACIDNMDTITAKVIAAMRK